MPRKTAFKALLEYSRTKKNIELAHLEGLKNLSQKNRNLAVEIIFGVIRYERRINYIIKQTIPCVPGLKGKLKPKPMLVLKTAIYQIVFLDKIPDYAAVNESIKLLHNPFEKTYINKFLRYLCQHKKEIKYPEAEADYLSIFYSYPLFLVERWLKIFDKKTLIDILKAGNTPSPVSLRINTLKTNLDDFIKKLENNNINHYNIDPLANSISVKNINPADITGFNEGFFYVQDKTATKAGLATDCKEGESVLDLCAAPGGKTTHMAELMKNKGQITALDVSDNKIQKIQENITRLGIEIIKPVKYDGDDLTFLEKKSFDKILIDAPCSNTGVLSRRPEARWNLSNKQLANLKDIQWKLLNNAMPYLKDNGILIYSTCSIDPDENTQIVKRFIESNPQFKVIKEETTLPAVNRQDGGYFACLKTIQ